MITWQFEDDLGVCHVRVSQRGKTQIRLRVKERDLIEISAPKHLTAKRLQTFLAEHQAWLHQQRAQLTSDTQPEHIWYQGRQLPILMRPVNTEIEFQSDACVVSSSLERPYRSLLQHLQQHAHKQLLPRLKTWLPTQHANTDLRLSNAQSYWGICRPQQIKLNWRLIGAPTTVMDYVCVHEMCHLNHPNHSAAFWQAVAEHMPDYRTHRLWLKQHGSAIMQSCKLLVQHSQ